MLVATDNTPEAERVHCIPAETSALLGAGCSCAGTPCPCLSKANADQGRGGLLSCKLPWPDMQHSNTFVHCYSKTEAFIFNEKALLPVVWL